jgi:hypothetical protein
MKVNMILNNVLRLVKYKIPIGMESNQFMMMNIPISIGKNKVSLDVFMFKIANWIHVVFQNL